MLWIKLKDCWCLLVLVQCDDVTSVYDDVTYDDVTEILVFIGTCSVTSPLVSAFTKKSDNLHTCHTDMQSTCYTDMHLYTLHSSVHSQKSYKHTHSPTGVNVHALGTDYCSCCGVFLSSCRDAFFLL
jgi:CRISPR/Cas system-associated endonuclease Cas1